MRIGLWMLGAEVLALDVGPSVEHPESETTAGSGGQFEIGFVRAGETDEDQTWE